MVAPATANFIGKVAGGIGDDLLTTIMLAATRPVLICPAMNAEMWANPVVQGNLARLKGRGLMVMEPAAGPLACGAVGLGRLPEPDLIVEAVAGLLSPRDLAGRKVLVTAGPTHEDFDPVRFLTNRSSGKQGYALARVAWRRGADVTLVSGPTSLPAPYGVKCVHGALRPGHAGGGQGALSRGGRALDGRGGERLPAHPGRNPEDQAGP